MEMRKQEEGLELNVPVKLLSDDEIAKIESGIKERDEWYWNFFRFSLLTGMPRNEILSLTWHHVDIWKHLELQVPNIRAPRVNDPNSRRIKIDEELLGLLLEQRSPYRWVFQKTGKRMLGGTVTLFFSELSRDLDIAVTNERIRWTFAKCLHDSISPSTDEDWGIISTALDHKDLDTTREYFQRNLAS